MLGVLLGTLSDLITVCTQPANLILQSAQLINPARLFGMVQLARYICQICFRAPLNIPPSSLYVFIFERLQRFLQRILLLHGAPLI